MRDPQEDAVFKFWPENEDWSWHLLRPLAEADFGGGEAQECLRAASRIRPGDREGWHAEWRRLADEVREKAEAAEGKGRWVTAREGFLRASNYYRWAEFFLDPEDERRLPTYRRCIESFRKGGRYFEPPLERVQIPYEGDFLPGYFYPSRRGPKSPGVLYVAGADVLKEELYFLGGKALIERGVSLLVMDGPGQGETLRFKKIPSRPDYEKPIGAALDYLERRPEVDPRRLGLVGRSFGGYYGARAAAFDPRIRACVLFGALYEAVDLFDTYPAIRRQLQWLTGSSTPEETRERLKAFTLGGVIERVTCPLLVIHGEDDHLVPAHHARRTFEGARGEKELLLYPSGEPGAIHCQYDSFPETIPYLSDWLAERLGRVQS